MNLRRTLLRPVAFAAGLHARRQLGAFLAAHRRTRQVQRDLLRELLAAHAGTAFGRDHGFAKLRTPEEFASAVPLGSYADRLPYVRAVLAGQFDALLPGGEKPLMFSMTSGTTGEPKFIPVPPRFAAVMKRGWNLFGVKVLMDHPDGWLRPILTISSAMRETDSPTGLPCGAISGLLNRNQKRIVRRMYVVPPGAAEIKDPAAKYYTILRCGIARDVAILTTANPSSAIKLIETGQAHAERLVRDVADGALTPPGADGAGKKFRPNPALARRLEEGIRRDGELLPRHFWNLAFLTHWTGGTLGLYLPRLRELFGPVPVRDIGLLASEGRFSVPLADGTPAGIAEITANYLEFIPAENRDDPCPPTLPAHALEIGREYFLVFSNWTGLFRYNLDDRVRVTGRVGESPVFEFLSRGGHTANLTGEKLTEHQAVEAMRRAADRAGAAVNRFVLQPCFARTPYYRLRIERRDGRDVDRLAALLDEELCGLNIEYRAKRQSARLGPVRAETLDPGALSRAEDDEIRRRRGRGEQYKHKYLLTDVAEGEES